MEDKEVNSLNSYGDIVRFNTEFEPLEDKTILSAFIFTILLGDIFSN